MKMNKLLLFASVAVCGLALSSCGGSGVESEYFAFQEKEGGRWGLMNADGDVLFEDYDDNKPWVLAKENINEFNKVMYTCSNIIANFGFPN